MWLAAVFLFICANKFAVSYITNDCGLRYDVNSHVPAISEGNATKQSEYPWHVTLYKFKDSSIPKYICGGSIIQSRAILTAAHCVYDQSTNKLVDNELVVATGKYHSSWLHRDPNEQRYKVVEKKIPKKYKGELNRHDNDIAVLVLNETIKFSDLVMPICVDWKSKHYIDNATRKGVVVGWGKTENKTISDALLVARLKYLDFTECKDLASDGYSKNYVTSDKFCTGSLNEGNVDIGDSGGGLMFPRNTTESSEQYFIYGVLSSREVNSSSDIASFTNVTEHLVWLSRTLSNIVAKIKVEEVCGKRSFVNYTDSHGKVTFTYRDRPWLATVYLERLNNFFGIRCVGSIIHPRAIITSAWCVDQLPTPVKLKVFVGKHEMNVAVAEQFEQRFNVSDKFIHPLYARSEWRAEHELAILVLDGEIQFNGAVLPICIDWEHKWNLHNSSALGKVVSWNFEGNHLQEEANYKYLDHDECGEKFKDIFSTYVTSDKDCGVFVNGNDFPFNSDVGGGVVFSTNGTEEGDHYLSGIVCNGRPDTKEFVTFSSIERNLDWIRETLESIYWSN